MTRKNRSFACRRVLSSLLLSSLLLFDVHALSAKSAESIPEDIEWTWEVHPAHPDPQLPNVLLLGDSITRNYFPTVSKLLDKKANVYLMAVSTSVGDPRLSHQIAEFAAMEKVRFQVVHFNNGMHGWAYKEEQYRDAFPSFLKDVRHVALKHGVLIWATITPVKSDASNGATNPRIVSRNEIALGFVRKAGIPVDDQNSLMQKHQDLYQDSVHFNSQGAALMGEQAAESIRLALGK